MNHVPPPEGAVGPADEDYALLSPKIARFAGASALLAGALSALDGLQVLASVTVRGPWAVLPPSLVALGVAAIALARASARAKRAATVAALATCAVIAVASAAWAFFAMSRGFFTLYAIWTPAGAALGIVATAVSLPACDRAERARARMAADGLNLGL